MPHCVLVIDDEETICLLLKTVLEDEGYSVLVARGEAALQVAHEARPSLILLDLMMPTMDGYELARRLRAQTDTATIPLVVMSASTQGRAEAARIGAAEYLPKPFDLDALVATVSTLAPLCGRAMRRNACAHASPVFRRGRQGPLGERTAKPQRLLLPLSPARQRVWVLRLRAEGISCTVIGGALGLSIMRVRFLAGQPRHRTEPYADRRLHGGKGGA